jgi:hydrogenase 3 maturation protease
MGPDHLVAHPGMNPVPWQAAFLEILERLHDRYPAPRIALVGVGHALRADDAAGLHFVRRVARLEPEYPYHPGLLVLDAGAAPENFSGVLRRFAPHLVVFVDAAWLEAEPGALRWLPWQATGGLSASTHTLPLRLIASYLSVELSCQIGLLGIQPSDLTTGAPLTPPVAGAVAVAAQAWLEIIYRFGQELAPTLTDQLVFQDKI